VTPRELADTTGELRELWELVEELGDLSERLRRAADAAVVALRDRKPLDDEEQR
jgi:hypothetical protein